MLSDVQLVNIRRIIDHHCIRLTPKHTSILRLLVHTAIHTLAARPVCSVNSALPCHFTIPSGMSIVIQAIISSVNYSDNRERSSSDTGKSSNLILFATTYTLSKIPVSQNHEKPH